MDLISLEEERRIIPVGGVVDPDTVLLVHSDTFNGDIAFVDSSPIARTFTPGGGITHSTAQAKFGASSIRGGASKSIVTVDSSDFTVGSGDFTIDCWFMRSAVSSTTEFICGQAANGLYANTRAIELGIQYTNLPQILLWSNTGVIYPLRPSTTLTDTTTWHYIKGTRVGNTAYLYIDGVLECTLDVTGLVINDSAYNFAIGCSGEHYHAYNFIGYIDEFRFVVGTGDATTTVPTAPY